MDSKWKVGEGRFIECGLIRKRDKEIQVTPQAHLLGPEVRSKFKERTKTAHLSSPGQGVALPTIDPSLSGLQSHPVR